VRRALAAPIRRAENGNSAFPPIPRMRKQRETGPASVAFCSGLLQWGLRKSGCALGGLMKLTLLIAGILILLLGLHWVSEGTGILAYPHSPLMYLQPMWTYIGIATAIAGGALIWLSRR
jgi:hypothetical protein